MKAITKYIADDGREFYEQTKCARYEAECLEIADLMSQLVPRPDKWHDQDGYIQQDVGTFNHVRAGLIAIAERIGENFRDSDHKALNRAWYRMMATDDQGREYRQPYYRHHPDEVKDVRLNP